MQAENWITIKKILDEIMKLSPSKRQVFLDNSNLPDEIRHEVESLIAVESQAESFLSVSAGSLAAEIIFHEKSENNKLIGQKIGIYEIVDEIGIGGMGAVYLAERKDGKFEQKVALKMLKREYNVRKIRRNFQRETEIQSKLNHPNIARLLDSGTTEDGIPFLAMEYVEGMPIDKYCEANNPSLKSRLKLFNKVCEAVAYAHRNLIVHRDLKPSNIIVTEDGEPKLLDFGISKLLDTENGDEKSSITMLGAMTPEYASPEQLKGETVTTATDVYSLGVVLYKILTGRHPFEIDGKKKSALIKTIIETEPTKPSAVLSENLKNPRSAIRHPQLKGDLDNIILKALSKEQARRYQSVNEFSIDIWRFIDGLPVAARPATSFYRALKFYKRNKIAVVAGVFVFLSLISGIIISIRQTGIAKAQARITEDSRNQAELETSKAKSERLKSEKITIFVSKIIGYANPSWYAEGAKSKGEARVLDALEDLSEKIDVEFANEPDVAAELHHKFAESLSWASRNQSGEIADRLKKKTEFHVIRALELRKQFYGEHHELVAKDMFYAIGIIPKNWEERAEMLMKAMTIMRETNPNNLNYPYMIESYTHRLMSPKSPETHEIYRQAVQPPTDENKYQIAERMLRESLPVFRFHYKEDNSAIFEAECQLSYVLAMQDDRKDFEDHYSICRQYAVKLNNEGAQKTMNYYVEMIEKALAEKRP